MGCIAGDWRLTKVDYAEIVHAVFLAKNVPYLTPLSNHSCSIRNESKILINPKTLWQ